MLEFETVLLSTEDRSELSEIVKKGTKRSRKTILAMALLWCDRAPGGPAQPDNFIRTKLGLGENTLKMVKQVYNEKGVLEAVNYKVGGDVPCKIDNTFEKKLIALATSTPPNGRRCWSVRLLTHQAVQQKLIDSISHMSVYRLLKKHNLIHAMDQEIA